MQTTMFTLHDPSITIRPVKVRAKRYTFPRTTSSSPVVIFMHGTGSHKEMWDPVLEDMYAQYNDGLSIEAWAVDCANHGESAALNEEDSRKALLAIEDYSRQVMLLLRGDNCPIQRPNERPFYLVAHSAAGSAAGILVTLLNHPNIHMILVEPVPDIFCKDPEAIDVHRGIIFAESTKKKRDIWPSRENAREWFSKRTQWKNWDPRALDLYVKYGLRDLPTAEYPNKEGVTLSCTKTDEAWIYSREGTFLFIGAARIFQNSVARRVPIHVIFAEASVFRLDPEDPINGDITARFGCTVERVPDAGHSVAEENPAAIAHLVYKQLSKKAAKL